MATVAIIDSHAHPSAADYYSSFGEPIAGGSTLKVGSIVRLPQMRLDQLLAELAKLAAGSTAVIVSHGTSGGLIIQMSEKTSVKGFPPEAAALLLRFVSGHVAEDEVAKQLKMPRDEAAALKSGLLAARAKKLERLVFRACRFGDYTSDLDRLRELLGAKYACAPDLYDSYVSASPGTVGSDARVWRHWLQKHPGNVLSKTASGRFAYHRTVVQRPHRFKFDVMADSWDAVREWVAANLGPTARKIDGAFPVHALQNGSMIFPTEQGYLDHLHEVPGKTL